MKEITMKGNDRANIMVVDDTPVNLRLICRMLEDKNHVVRPFPSGAI